MTNPAAPPTLTTPEQILTRLIAVLSGVIYALIDASLLPRAMRNHLRREFATYFADLTARLIASLTTPIPAPAAPAPHASVAVGTPTARATPRLTIPRLTIRRARTTQRTAPAPAAAARPRPENSTQARTRAIPQSRVLTTPIPRNFQKTLFAPKLCHAHFVTISKQYTKSVKPRPPGPMGEA